MMTRREMLICSAAVAAVWAVPGFGAEGGEEAIDVKKLPAHPRLSFDKSAIGELKARIESQPWAKAAWESLKKNADAVVGKLPTGADLPPRGGNWSHNYVCPTHGTRLKQGKLVGAWKWEHICPTGPHTLLGDPAKGTTDFDGNAIMGIHLGHAEMLKDMGLLYHYTGEEKYAAYGRALLLAYAERYLTYKLHDKDAKLVADAKAASSGRVACQPLTEASWLIGMAQGADFVWDILSDEEQKKAETGMFRPCLEQILLPSKLGIHNIQCRINSAIGLTGFLLGDQKLIGIALDEPKHGFKQQIAQGIRGDGMWAEGSTGYHFFTIDGLWPLMEAARIAGLDLYSQKFKSMFDGPFELAKPDNVLPNFNDSGDSPLAGHAAAYELGLARFGDPKYAAVIRAATNRPREQTDEEGGGGGAPRQNRMALYFGVYPLPDASLAVRMSHNDLASGYAIIQRGNDVNATWLCMKYGPHGGGHGHPDKNHFILYTRGAVLAPDVGTHAYGSPLHASWDKTTLAHNTLVVDETSQTPAEGKSIAFGNAGGVDYSISHAGKIYEGVDFVRTAAVIDENLIVFIDQIVSEDSHVYDVAYHQQGEWTGIPEGKDFELPKAAAYGHFSKATTRPLAGPLAVGTKVAGRSSGIVILPAVDDAPTEIVTGLGVLKSTEDFVPMMLMRRQAESTTFVWGLSLDGAGVKLEQQTVADGNGKALAAETALLVTVTRGEKKWTLVTNSTKANVVVGGKAVGDAFAVI